jgi:hypothetical protein
MKQRRLRAWRLARAAQRAEHQTPPSPAASDLPAIAAKADDLEEIKKSVEDAASVSGGLWLSYLFVLSYIAIAAGAVTHEDLLLIRPVKLPFLNVELPLKAFFALAPYVVLKELCTLNHFLLLPPVITLFVKISRAVATTHIACREPFKALMAV